MFLPWFAVGPTQLIWYMLPAVPFICLVATATIRRLPPNARTKSAILFAAGTLPTGLLFLPMWTGWRVPGS
jgi:hypothetical protein